MALIRFPDLSKPKLDEEGTFRVKIVAITFKRSKKNLPLILMTFETLKSKRQITQCWPVYQCQDSLLHVNLKEMLGDQELVMVNTDELFGLKCRIEVFRNDKGYLEVKAIPFKKSNGNSAD